MNDRRVKGLEKEISRIIGTAILTEVKNEKIRDLVTVHSVKLTKDGRYVDITFSILNSDGNVNKENIVEDLQKMKGYFRKLLADNLDLRYTPEVRIALDDTVEYSVKIASILNEVLPKKDDNEE